MIKDVMVRLDGSPADSLRLDAAKSIADTFDGQIIGLFLNPLPLPIIPDFDGAGAVQAAELLQLAKDVGDRIEADLTARLSELDNPRELRRFDVLPDEVIKVATREARSADTFVAIRPNGEPEDPDRFVEGVLFGSGRHLFLVPQKQRPQATFDNVLVAWNGSRESARALTEAMPYLHRARLVAVVVVDELPPVEMQAVLGSDVIGHLRHHGIDARLRHVRRRDAGTGASLIAEAKRENADLIVMGGYGHSRLREWLLGGVTYELLHNAPVQLIVAH
jgi:nucleotide-binding universal stress UspA family protein